MKSGILLNLFVLNIKMLLVILVIMLILAVKMQLVLAQVYICKPLC